MTINTTHDLMPGDLFTKDGKDVWEVVAIRQVPSVVLKNLRDNIEEDFCLGGTMAKSYVRLLPESKE